MNRAKLLGGASIVALVAVVVVGWVFVRDTQWWADLTESEAAAEVPTDLTEVFNTALVERADVSDEAELVGELRYQDAIDFVHRTDPVISFVTTTTGNGRQAQTVTTTVETPGQRTVTGLPTPGSVIDPGDVLYETDSTPVFTALGEVAAWRTLDSTTSGPDVEQLQTHLTNGRWAPDGFETLGEWSTALTTAIETWQADTDQTVTGTVPLGDIWFISGPIRVTRVQATEGVIVEDGAAVFSYTSSDRAIEASLAEIPEGLLQADDLRVRLPGVGEVAATLRSTSGTDDGFDLLIDVETTEGVPEVNGIDATVSWTTSSISNALTLPPEALRRIDTGEYIADVLVGDSIEATPVDVIGQAGRLVAIDGLEERTRVLIP